MVTPSLAHTGAVGETIVQAGSYAVDSSGAATNSAAISSTLCETNYYSAAGATECTACSGILRATLVQLCVMMPLLVKWSS